MARRTFPLVCTLILMLLACLPLGIGGQAMLLPALALACVFFWSLFRPSSMTPPEVFVLGVLLDLLGQLPLGVGVLMLLGTHGVAVQSRRVLLRHGFLLVWFALLLIASGAFVGAWLLSSLLGLRLYPFKPVLFQIVLTMAVYPALATLFARAHASAADPERA